MSQGAGKSQPPEVGIEPGPQDLKANTVPRRCKSWLLPQGSRSVFNTYPYHIFPCFKLIRPRIYSEPAVIPGHFLVNIISVSFDWALKIYRLIISLAHLLNNYIGYMVSHSLIKGHLGVENSHFRR